MTANSAEALQLLARATGGDREAMNELFNRYRSRLKMMVRLSLVSGDEAQERRSKIRQKAEELRIAARRAGQAANAARVALDRAKGVPAIRALVNANLEIAAAVGLRIER